MIEQSKGRRRLRTRVRTHAPVMRFLGVVVVGGSFVLAACVTDPGGSSRPAPDIAGYVCVDASNPADDRCTPGQVPEEDQENVPMRLVPGNGSATAEATTDAQGYFDFGSRPGGSYTISVLATPDGSTAQWDADGITGASVNKATINLPNKHGVNRGLDFIYR